MKKTFTTAAVIFMLLLIQIPYSFGQDTKTEKTTKGDKNNTDEDDTPQDEKVPVKKKKVEHVTPHVMIGIEAGISSNYLYGNFSTDAQLGGRFGLSLYVPIVGKFVFQPGLFCVWGGGNYTTDGGITTTTYTISTIEVPLLFGFRYGHHRHLKSGYKSFIGIGPYIGGNVSGTFNDGSGNNGPLNIGSDASNDIKRIDYGIELCTSGEFRSGFFIRTRWQYGFNMAPLNSGYTMSSVSVGIQVGYLFGNRPRYKMVKSNEDDDLEMKM